MFDISARLKTFCACFSGDAPAKTCTRMSIHWSCRVWNSGVTTMGSDRVTPGAPNPIRPNGGHKAQAIEQKHRPGRPLICYNVVFWPSEFSDHQNSVKSLPKSKRWHFRESRFKSFRVRICPGPPRKLVHIRRSTRAFGTSTRGAFENFEPGAPWYNVTPLVWKTLAARNKSVIISKTSSVRYPENLYMSRYLLQDFKMEK
jgi:hypothetical protein